MYKEQSQSQGQINLLKLKYTPNESLCKIYHH